MMDFGLDTPTIADDKTALGALASRKTEPRKLIRATIYFLSNPQPVIIEGLTKLKVEKDSGRVARLSWSFDDDYSFQDEALEYIRLEQIAMIRTWTYDV